MRISIMSFIEARPRPAKPGPVSPADMIGAGLCIGCGACASASAGTMDWDRFGQLKPTGPAAWMSRRSLHLAPPTRNHLTPLNGRLRAWSDAIR